MDERRISVQLKVIDYATGCWTGRELKVPQVPHGNWDGANVLARLEDIVEFIEKRLADNGMSGSGSMARAVCALPER